jgi:hypothetical protein
LISFICHVFFAIEAFYKFTHSHHNAQAAVLSYPRQGNFGGVAAADVLSGFVVCCAKVLFLCEKGKKEI